MNDQALHHQLFLGLNIKQRKVPNTLTEIVIVFILLFSGIVSAQVDPPAYTLVWKDEIFSIAMNKKINILGLGNTILGDEGFGVEAVRYLESRFQCPPEINIIDGGTQGLYLLDYIESADCLMIFDAVIPTSYDFKVYVYRNDDLPAFIHRKLSAHQMGLSELLSVAKLHDKVPDEVVLIGVPPKNLEMNIGLTDEVQNLIPDAVDRGVEIIKEWLDE